MVAWCSFIPFGAMGFGFVSQPIMSMHLQFFFVFEVDYASSFSSRYFPSFFFKLVLVSRSW
jgi:hypothetical protein